MTQPTVSFVIPVRNDARRLRGCLRSIKASRYSAESLDLVVVDNGSTDDSAAVAEAEGATVLVVPGQRVGELRNRAVRVARGDILAFVDADHEIDPGWAASAVMALADENVAAVGAPYCPPSPATWVQRMYDGLRRHPHGQEVVEWLGSGNMAVRRSAFEAVGGLDITLNTCEDVDLCRKLRGNGFTILADSRLHSVHHGDPRTLRHVFFGELWRGRDNVRVSLRRPRYWRTLVSLAIPVFNLLAFVIVVAGTVSMSRLGFVLAAVAALSVSTIIAIRTSVIIRGIKSPGDWFRALAVAAAYEAGRALALTARFGHKHRREGATA